MKILLLEDDLALSDIIEDHLTHSGYEVTLASNGQDALEYLIDNKYDLALLDINTPIMSGIEVLQTIRHEYKDQTPVIILTAYQDTRHLKVSFESGVDDYIKKPFDLEELDQRILKLCRHFSINQNEAIQIDKEIYFSPNSCEVIKSNKKISIAQKERDMLKYFVTHKNRVISSDELLQNIWEYDEMPTDATIRVYIKNLRELLGKERIETIRGIGYKFVQ